MGEKKRRTQGSAPRGEDCLSLQEAWESCASLLARLDERNVAMLMELRSRLEGLHPSFPPALRRRLSLLMGTLRKMEEGNIVFEDGYRKASRAFDRLTIELEDAATKATSAVVTTGKDEGVTRGSATGARKKRAGSRADSKGADPHETVDGSHASKTGVPCGESLSEADREGLLMDLGVMHGLLQEMDDDDTEIPDVVLSLVTRMASQQGLPQKISEGLSTLAVLCRRSREAPPADDFRIAATAAVSSLMEEVAASGHSTGEAVTSTAEDVRCDTEKAERYLQCLEDFESYALATEKGASCDKTASFLIELATEASDLALGKYAPGLRMAANRLAGLTGREASTLTDFLLELNDALSDHLNALLDGRHDPAVTASLEACLENLCARQEERGDTPEGTPLIYSGDPSEAREFLAEASEYVQTIEEALMELEKEPYNEEMLHEAFRGFHNLKGSAGFLKLGYVVDLAHAAESLLSEMREGRLRVSGPYIDLSLKALDGLKEILSGLESVLSGEKAFIPDRLPVLVEELREAATRSLAIGTEASAKGDSLAKEIPSTAEAVSPQSSMTARADSLVKVSTNRLDALIDAVGELVIAHSMVLQELEQAVGTKPRLAANLSQLTKITRELQELAMGMRMVSLKNTFQKMARLARDLSTKSGTPIDFTYSGEDTEIDRNLVEEINSPLVHMVRNAVDHGIESPEERRRAGKPERGRIELRGYHEGGNVVIELSDDGRGLDAGSILEKALDLGVISREDVSRLGDEEVYRLIFHEGLSTAREVTDISGRGVGMDVVKKTIEGLRGRVDISSRPGEGTTFTIRLPLTLAIIDGMVVRVAGEEYVVPSISIHSSFRPRREQVSTVTGKGEVISLRGEIIPLFRLHRLFGLEGAKHEPWEALALIIGSNGDRCAVMVDDIAGQQQVVIKSLGEMFSRLPGVSGGAIMGSGKVALILDPPGLINLAHGRGVT